MIVLAEQTVATAPPSITLVISAAVLISGGVYLMLARSLVQVLLGVVLAGNGVAVLFLVAGGRAGSAPISGGGSSPAQMSDPLPQAMILTAIVIALATVAFVLALAYRDWTLNGTDDVPDDMEDARIRRLAEEDRTSSTYDDDTTPTTEAAEDPIGDANAEAESVARAFGLTDRSQDAERDR